MTNVAQIKPRQDQAVESPDPRAALASAIAGEREARSAADRCEQALERGRGMVVSAQDEKTAATKLLERARDRDSRATAAAVRSKSSGASPDASATRSARLRVQQCDDDIEVAEGAITRLEQECIAARDAARWATNNVLVARNNLLAEFAARLLELARARRRDLKVAEAALSEMLNNDTGAAEFEDTAASIRAREERTAELGARRKEAAAFFMSRRTDDEAAAEAAAVSEIRAFVARLATDAAAELPPIP